jgi:hypothetical protein
MSKAGLDTAVVRRRGISRSFGPHHCLTMSESMGNANAGPKPGTAFKVILEEYEFLDEFMKMMKKK